MKKFKIFLIILLNLFTMSIAYGTSANTSEVKQIQNSGPNFSKFTAKDINGNNIDETILKKADLTMINIWGTFCPPCLREMPDLGEISREYKDKKFQIIGIVVDVQDQNGNVIQSQVSKAKNIIEKTKADYTHLVISQDLANIYLNSVHSIPDTIFVDKNGTVVSGPYLGSRPKSEWIKIINDAIK